MFVDKAYGPQALPVLWMDDMTGMVASYADLLLEQANPIQVRAAGSIKEARELLRRETFSAMIVDCKMDVEEESENGARFLQEVNRQERFFPTFVYSAFLSDPLYKELIEQSYSICSVSKVGKISDPISKDPFFRRVVDEASMYWSLRDMRPEEIEFLAYLENPGMFAESVRVHWAKHRVWIEKELELRRWSWCVVCGQTVVAGASERRQFPSDAELEELGRENHLIPFAYSRDALPEELETAIGVGCKWAETREEGDWYPTVRVRIKGEEVEGDFDTGAIVTHVAAEMVGRSWNRFLREAESQHLGAQYCYYTRKIEISVISDAGEVQSKQLPVNVVEEWKSSPFVRVNRSRRALVGRDILGEFDLRLCLDSARRITHVEFLGEK